MPIEGNSIHNLLNKHKGEAAVVVGSSPSVREYQFNDEDKIIISMGDAPLRGIDLFKTDYYVAVNPDWPLPWQELHAEAVNLFNPANVIYATAGFAWSKAEEVESQIEEILSKLNTKVTFFDQRHFQSKLCQNESGCCRAFLALNMKETMQELFASSFGLGQLYSQGASVAIHSIALALIMGCNPIRIVGIDFPMRKKEYIYFNSEKSDFLVKKYQSMGPFPSQARLSSKEAIFNKLKLSRHYALLKKIYFWVKNSEFRPDKKVLIDDLKYLVTAADSKNIKIENYSKKSLLREIPGILFKGPSLSAD